MAKTRNSFRFTTPVATLNFIHVVTPDTKYGAPTYQVTVQFPEDEGLKVIAQMEKLDPRFKGMIRYSVKDGVLTFKVKQKRYISWYKDGVKQESEQVPVLVNADNTKFEGTEPWGGTTGEVGLTVDMTKDNNQKPAVALRLKGIRFHDIKSGGAGNDDPLFGGAVAESAAGAVEESGAGDQDDDGDDDSFFS